MTIGELRNILEMLPPFWYVKSIDDYKSITITRDPIEYGVSLSQYLQYLWCDHREIDRNEPFKVIIQ